MTARLMLRSVTEQDVTPSYIEALNDPEVVRYTEARHVRWDRERVLQWIRQSNREGVSLFVGIFLKDSRRHIGNMRLFNFHPIYRRSELSFIIFDRTQWGKGYGTEAVRALTDHAFDTLKLHRIHADYYAPNAGSTRVFQKAGFEVEGAYKEHVRLDGEYVDSIRVAKVNPAERPAAPPPSMIPSAGPSITDREVQLVTEAARTGWYEHMSRDLEEFERRFSAYSGMKYCLATNSGTGALHLAMLGLRLGPGDEVIVPDITWVASAAAVCYVGATPVFADVDPTTWCLSPKALERTITRRTKAVVVVDLLGNVPDMDAVRTIARQRGIQVIEDAAQAIGAEYRSRTAGTFGRMGIFSFMGTKLMVTGEGGMLVTDDKQLSQRAKGLAHHGLLMRGARSRLFWSYELGYKYKMTNLQAALGIAQLERIEELVERRRQLFRWYQTRLQDLDGVQLNREGAGVRSTFWVTAAMVNPRFGFTKEAMVRELARRHIAARPFYYPLSAMPPFARYCRGRQMQRVNPVAYALAPYGICLPSAFSLTEADVEIVCGAFREILARASRRSRPGLRGINGIRVTRPVSRPTPHQRTRGRQWQPA